MNGARTKKLWLVVLRELGAGGKTKADLKRAGGYDVCRESPTLDRLLRDMRVAGLIVARGKTWELAQGTEVCPECHGRGIRKEAG